MRLREVANVPVSANAYCLYLRQREEANAQVFSLDYGDRLRVYDTSGAPKSARPWSSKVRCIAVADIEGEGDDALVGGVGKKVLIVDQKGQVLWKIDLESPIIAIDARDVDGDDSAEVVVALQNKRIILWNDDKIALFSRKIDNPIADIWLEDITGDTELEVVIADRRGWVSIMTAAGYEIRTLELGENITIFAVLVFGDRRLFVTGNHSNVLNFWDIEGNKLESVELSGKPKAIATGIPDDVSDMAYMVISTDDRRLAFFEIRENTKASREERVIMQQIESTKTIVYRRAIKCGNCGAPTSPESARCEACGATLELLDEYKIEEFIKESIDSVTQKHTRIKLKDLDRILRRTLPRPAAYNLRRSLQAMIEKKEIEGHIDGNCFVRTAKKSIPKSHKPSKEDVRKLGDVLMSLLRKEHTFEIDALEKSTGVHRSILRQTLMILLGEGLIEGEFQDNIFELKQKQNTKDFVRRLQNELMMHIN